MGPPLGKDGARLTSCRNGSSLGNERWPSTYQLPNPPLGTRWPSTRQLPNGFPCGQRDMALDVSAAKSPPGARDGRRLVSCQMGRRWGTRWRQRSRDYNLTINAGQVLGNPWVCP